MPDALRINPLPNTSPPPALRVALLSIGVRVGISGGMGGVVVGGNLDNGSSWVEIAGTNIPGYMASPGSYRQQGEIQKPSSSRCCFQVRPLLLRATRSSQQKIQQAIFPPSRNRIFSSPVPAATCRDYDDSGGPRASTVSAGSRGCRYQHTLSQPHSGGPVSTAAAVSTAVTIDTLPGTRRDSKETISTQKETKTLSHPTTGDKSYRTGIRGEYSYFFRGNTTKE